MAAGFFLIAQKKNLSKELNFEDQLKMNHCMEFKSYIPI